MRIGELAEAVGVSTDTVRFYERSGWLPRASRRDNAYREYGPADVEHLRLIIDLRRLGSPARGRREDRGLVSFGALRRLHRRAARMIEARRDGDRRPDRRPRRPSTPDSAGLLGHLGRPRRSLAVLDGPCCEAADAVVGAAEGRCACCTPEPAVTH